MEAQLFSIMRRDQHGLIAIGDRFDLFALLAVPIWALWHGLWITFAGIIVILVVAGTISPLAISPALSCLALIAAFEGAAVRQVELEARGWREVAVVEARTPEGAEELYMAGLAA